MKKGINGSICTVCCLVICHETVIQFDPSLYLFLASELYSYLLNSQALPLFAVINDVIFVLHGGLFHTKDITLSELDDIDRAAFSLQDIPEGGDGSNPIPRHRKQDFLKQCVRDALWSDPSDQLGLSNSVRGEVLYGRMYFVLFSEKFYFYIL